MTRYKQILMGGSGSTGSSLLKNVLGRHPVVFSSQETSIFAKKQVYLDWSAARRHLFGKRLNGLCNHGFHRYRGVDVYPDETGFTRTTLRKSIKSCEDICAFSELLFLAVMTDQNKSVWLEKTPANSALFKEFLKCFPNGLVIHTVRNPLDTIASLHARGFDLFYATSLYILNTASGIRSRNSPHYREIRYEELVKDPESVVRNLCEFMGLQFHRDMLTPDANNQIETTTLTGWQYDETKRIEKGSVGRFSKLGPDEQSAIVGAVRSIRISDWGKAYYDLQFESIEQLAELFGYEIPDLSYDESILSSLKSGLNRDRRYRVLHLYPYGLFNYPIEILSNRS